MWLLLGGGKHCRFHRRQVQKFKNVTVTGWGVDQKYPFGGLPDFFPVNSRTNLRQFLFPWWMRFYPKLPGMSMGSIRFCISTSESTSDLQRFTKSQGWFTRAVGNAAQIYWKWKGDFANFSSNKNETSSNGTHTIHVWFIYLHLVDFSACR